MEQDRRSQASSAAFHVKIPYDLPRSTVPALVVAVVDGCNTCIL